MTIRETYNEGDPFFVLSNGEWVTVWCPKSYKVLSGGYDWTFPDWQDVTGSRPRTTSSRQGWQFRVHVSWYDSGAIGQVRGHLYAVCRG
jgi:hypothetical protein